MKRDPAPGLDPDPALSPERRLALRRSAAAAVALALPVLANAQPAAAAAAAGWPRGPVRIVVNFAPGSSPDVVARAVAGPLQAALGRPVVIENRSGASGVLGADAVAKAAPDGQTWLASAGSTIAIEPLINDKMPFDAARDLQPVAALGRIQLILVVRSDSPYRSYRDLFDAVKARPGRLSYGSPGSGTSPHLAGEMFKSQTGSFVVHVPYRGSAPALQDLLAGQVDYLFDPGIAIPHVRSGRLRALAVTSLRRLSVLPEVPTLDELGLKGFDGGTTHALYAPAGVPQAIVQRMNAEVNKALGLAEVRNAIEALGAEVALLSPADVQRVSDADRARFAPIIRERRIGKDS